MCVLTVCAKCYPRFVAQNACVRIMWMSFCVIAMDRCQSLKNMAYTTTHCNMHFYIYIFLFSMDTYCNMTCVQSHAGAIGSQSSGSGCEVEVSSSIQAEGQTRTCSQRSSESSSLAFMQAWVSRSDMVSRGSKINGTDHRGVIHQSLEEISRSGFKSVTETRTLTHISTYKHGIRI